MKPYSAKLAAAAFACTLAVTAASLSAQPGPWRDRPAPSLEGQVDAEQFRADGIDPAGLVKGTIVVVRMPGEAGAGDARVDATFQAAVETALVGSGYKAGSGGEAGSQIAEVRVVRTEAEPAEGKRDPVSGQMSIGVSNRGTALGMAVHVDGTKPQKALLATQLEVRIRDRASGNVLWEGRAQMFSRDGDERWGDDAIAARLSRAMFTGFPGRTGELRERR